ncbi:MAG TPA: DUF4340 domain-containing protein [Prolixibacteraceae bacterium]|nr:DUF4340 domain-containing protein [Prolixibacteraceae bacterium]HPR59694.1 DUF4340 domain-containing protein [Prolixibacteraceae bacterium]
MRKTINNKWLLVVFVVLLALVVVQFSKSDGHKERSFDKELVKFNSDEIAKITLFPKNLNGESIDLQKSNNAWQIETDGKSYNAGQNTIDGMLNSLSNLKALSLAGNSKDRWDSFEVSDSLATRVQLFNQKNKKVADVYIGKFKFSQPRSMSTYVRIDGKKETYRVDGFLSSMFNRNVNDLRDKTITADQVANWTQLTFDYPSDSSFVLSKQDGQWMLDGVLANQNEVSSYINAIKKQNGMSLVDEPAIAGTPMFRITIERENLTPIMLSVYENAVGKLLVSSENEGVAFSDQSVIDRFFVSKSKFEIR